MKARKYKQRWAKLSDDEAERIRDLSKPFDESAPPLKTAPDGSLWADPVLLAAWRSQHTSGADRA